jgi:putative transposase
MACNHARKQLNDQGRQATEKEIAAAAAALLDTASRGPAPAGAEPQKSRRKSRRAAARAGAGGQPSGPRPGPATPPAEHGGTGQDPGEDAADGDEDLADVVPLGIFDAREEARRWW